MKRTVVVLASPVVAHLPAVKAGRLILDRLKRCKPGGRGFARFSIAKYAKTFHAASPARLQQQETEGREGESKRLVVPMRCKGLGEDRSAIADIRASVNFGIAIHQFDIRTCLGNADQVAVA